MAKRNRYTDEYRTNAVLMLEAAGYPNKKGALMQVSKLLKTPYQTLSRWFREIQNPPPPEMVHEKRFDLVEAIKSEIQAAIGEMGQARQDADYRTLATAFGIFVDKLQLLTGEPTERSDQRIIIDRTGISTIPEHLARGTRGSHQEPEAVQRSGVRA